MPWVRNLSRYLLNYKTRHIELPGSRPPKNVLHDRNIVTSTYELFHRLENYVTLSSLVALSAN